MTAAAEPSGVARIAVSTASADSAGTIATSLPSFATWSGSRPRSSHAARTGAGTGIAGSSRTMPTPDACAISLSADDSPPRVGSRRTWTSGSTASIAATSPLSAWVSDAISTSNSRPSRTDITATPCRPISPERITTSPGTARSAAGADAIGDDPDARGVDEQPVRAPAAHDLRVAGDDRRAGTGRGRGRRRGDRPQLLERQPLLDDVGQAQRHRPGAHHREVVDRAVDGELADVAAREPDGRDDERVGGEREALGADLDDRGVVEHAARGGGRERGRKDVAHEPGGELAAGPVAQDHPGVLRDRRGAGDVRRVDAGAGLVDGRHRPPPVDTATGTSGVAPARPAPMPVPRPAA